MENVFTFLSQYRIMINILIAICSLVIGICIARLLPPKKPKSHGDLHIIHYPNDFKELYLDLNSDINTFEKDSQICFNIVNDHISAV